VERSEKKDFVESLHGELKDAGAVVVTHYQGLTVAEITELREKVREAGAKFRVTKNTLTRLAVDGTQFESVVELFKGPTGIAYSEDPVAAAKAVVEFAKDNDNLVVLGGAMGETKLDKTGVESLAKMPSLDELRGTIVAMLQTPATRLAQVLQAPAGQVARVINAHSQQG
jgi:large subunit ribosomal protein L10